MARLVSEYISDEANEELLRLWRAEPRIFMESFLKIKTKDGRIIPFKFNRSQERVYAIIQRLRKEGKPVRLCILKGRQLGISTFVEALLFTFARIFENINCFIVAHRKDAAENIFAMSKFMLDSLPGWLYPMVRYASRNHLRFENPDDASRPFNPGLASEVRIAVAKNQVDIGAGFTIRACHLSELPRWAKPKETMLSIMQAVPKDDPNTFVIVESTARGATGIFYDLWRIAVKGKSGWTPVFLPYWLDPTYTIKLTDDEKAELTATLTRDEKTTMAKYPQIDLGRVAWRRRMIDTDCNGSVDMWNQEYPLTPDESFTSKGETIFDLPSIQWYVKNTVSDPKPYTIYQDKRKKVYVEPDAQGKLLIWEKPRPGEGYCFGCDSAMGTGDGGDSGLSLADSDGDYSAAVGLSLHRKQVARFRDNNIGPYEYADFLVMLGTYYQNALLFVEVGAGAANACGFAVAHRLTEVAYPRLGMWRRWDHRQHNKMTLAVGIEMIPKVVQIVHGKLAKALKHGAGMILPYPGWKDSSDPRLELRDRETLNEMTSFVIHGDGETGAKSGCNDDLVRALAIALIGLEQCPSPRDLNAITGPSEGARGLVPYTGPRGISSEVVGGGFPSWYTG